MPSGLVEHENGVASRGAMSLAISSRCSCIASMLHFGRIRRRSWPLPCASIRRKSPRAPKAAAPDHRPSNSSPPGEVRQRQSLLEAGSASRTPSFATLNQINANSGIQSESKSTEVGIIPGDPLLRDEGLFLNVTPIHRKKRLIIEVSALTPRSAKRRSHSA